MKLLVLALPGATPELLLGDERLANFRRLMQVGCYGSLASTVPTCVNIEWMSLVTSQDPGSLGLYGARGRGDYSYSSMNAVSTSSLQALAIWDQVANEGKRAAFVGEYPMVADGLTTTDHEQLEEQVYNLTDKQFESVRELIQSGEWDYIHLVEKGLDRLQQIEELVPDYYLYLDEQLGKLLELLTDDTAVLVVSAHGSQRLEGAFCLNEWLVKQGLLVLNHYPTEVTPIDRLDVNWDKTLVWSEGGQCAQLFLNVRGREPRGIIDPDDYENFRNDLKARLEQLVDDKGNSLEAKVYKPNEIYKETRNVPPDLSVQFAGLRWRVQDEVGYPALYARGTEDEPGYAPSSVGAFILAAPNIPPQGELEGASVLDIAPTLLALAGYEVPASMQGKSLVSADEVASLGIGMSDEEILRERLSGLGYI